jgi:hypothetical protein
MKTYNIGVDVQKIIDELPTGLERTILDVLRLHVGREKAVSRFDLISNLSLLGYIGHERTIRACINKMRKDGILICSTGGENGGYWIPENWDELVEYLNIEIHPRAMDLLEQEKAMKAKAEQTWGRYSPDNQAAMF